MSHRRKPSGAASDSGRTNPLSGIPLWKERYWQFMKDHVPGYDYDSDTELSSKDTKRLTPELLWRLACGYFEAAENDVIMQRDFIRSGLDAGRIIEIPRRRPYSLTGFEMYVEAYGIRARLSDFFTNRDSKYPGFEAVCNRIRSIITQDKYDGAAVGIYNANLVIRDLGLTEKVEAGITVEQPLFGDPQNND